LEKIKIAQIHLMNKQQGEHGLADNDLKMRKDSIVEIIQHYTREAGVRGLEREIGKIFRKVVTQMVKGGKKEKKQPGIIITPKSVSKYLGLPKYHSQEAGQSNEIGITNGLGVTSAGGELLITEVETMPGSGKRAVTGQLGDVMKESAEIAFSYLRSRADELGILTSSLKEIDIHIHLPENAVPKDGPSAGVTLVTSLASALTKIPVRKDVAMTGEVTLRGLVLQIGGLKEKLLAAKRHGMVEVLIPKENEKDLVDMPKEIVKEMKITPVERLEEVIAVALTGKPTPLTPEEIEADQRRLEEMSSQHPLPEQGGGAEDPVSNV
jgi:ATP-dependent Lon protease